ncbi:DUF2470 domain-containing protein [Mycetocola tolaasinivorans]|uniref:DUF2470 domain-containing protein n=1 Tax=Mycetocola tolaasinivorans TaxID=76635 RepID=A0A3L7A6V3_9MICO|nr:DUF2470 domain-containing protein [Mycetocola tolaasinivorans]RLP75291.1 DUF2470 domain-containing protein [Mycetocola tolaasinivorans]
MSAFVFAPEIVAGVLHHMNDDHNDDNLLIARAFGDRDATTAVMTALDGEGGTWSITVGDAARDLRVEWSTSITERPEIRREIVVLYDRACAELGLEPRPHA